MKPDVKQVLKELHALANPEAADGLSAFGIQGAQLLGIRIPELRRMARQIGKDQVLADGLWASGIHEARILASMIAEPVRMPQDKMDAWAADFDSWDVCDQCCGNLFVRTPWAHEQALVWSERPEEFVKRAGFALMAYLAVHDKNADEAEFEPFFEKITAQAHDSRNYVKKAVNWALRQIGKRSRSLNTQAITIATALAHADDPTTRWIGKDALRELTSAKIQDKLRT
ncbi:MAG: DNA alkylation repair protein [Anaerolineales bacterium]|jgi:3-methyladenine DNA glycosylase AlkD